jgi:hypothetical protein
MASPFTRSSRRTEGLSTRSSNTVVIPGPHPQGNSPANIGRKKRPRDESDHDEEKIIGKKRVKIAIEITPRSKAQPKTRSFVIKEENTVAEKYAATPPLTKSKHAATATQTELAKPPQPLRESAKKSTNHHEKVVNGIKHELDRLQPSAADLKDEKRKLRSQEGTRFKSELSAYFPEYDEVIGNDPKEERKLLLFAGYTCRC